MRSVKGSKEGYMDQVKATVAAFRAFVLSLWVMPALALAQQATQPGSAPSGAGNTVARDGGGSGFLWIIALAVIAAIIWWALSSRRRAHGTR
jgi:hypothetical protein